MKITQLMSVMLFVSFSFAIPRQAPQAQNTPQPTATGMFLCSTPASANWLWGNWASALNNGINLDYASEAQSAQKLGCDRINSDHLKPTDVSGGILLLTDGTKHGFAVPEYYVIYMRTHKVDAK